MRTRSAIGFILLIITLQRFSAANEIGEDYENCSDVYCLPNDYNKLAAPFKESGTLDVQLELDISQILEFDDIGYTVSILLYVSMVWEDPRIIGPTPDDPTKMFPIDNGFASSIWLPDIYIYDVKEIILSKFNIPFAGKIKYFDAENGMGCAFLTNLCFFSRPLVDKYNNRFLQPRIDNHILVSNEISVVSS